MCDDVDMNFLQDQLQGIKVTRNHGNQAKEDDDLDDSTYEQSSQEESEFTEEQSMEQDEQVDFCIPAEEIALLRAEATFNDGGASDYCASDDGEGPLPPPDDKREKVEFPTKLAKYTSRAHLMIQNPSQNRLFGLPEDLSFWVCRLARFNLEQRRWVDKGPIMVYFQSNRLVGNYLYSTKSSCLDLQLYEHLDTYWRHLQGNRLQFSTFGYNAVRHCQTQTQSLSSRQSNIIKCHNQISSRQELGSSLLTLKFPNLEMLNGFGSLIVQILTKVKQKALLDRKKSFESSTYSQSPEFVNLLATNGFKLEPTGNSETVQCEWCGVVLGPFVDIVDVALLHLNTRQAEQDYRISCPFSHRLC